MKGPGFLLRAELSFPFMYRVPFRDPGRPMIAHRYREDWVGLSDMWLGAIAVGLNSSSA